MPRSVLADPEEIELARPAQLDYLHGLLQRHDPGTMNVAHIDDGTLTKAEASAAIDWLKRRPALKSDNHPDNQPAKPSRPPQMQRASDPRREVKPVDPGYYSWSRQVTGLPQDSHLRVVTNVKSGRLNYHVLVAPPAECPDANYTWEYRQYREVDAMIRDWGEPDAMSTADIAAFGHRTAHCLCCGNDLSNPESLERGIGPQCYAKYGGAF